MVVPLSSYVNLFSPYMRSILDHVRMRTGNEVYLELEMCLRYIIINVFVIIYSMVSYISILKICVYRSSA